MPRLIIKLANKQDQIFEIDKQEIMIGRGEECDLVLPNIAISREHAKIFLGGDGAEIVDVNSENGLRINSEVVQKKQLKSKDEIFVGTFVLIYLDDSHDDKFYRGRSVNYLPQYNPTASHPNQDLTFKLTAKEAKSLIKEKGVLHNGCLLDERGRKFYPESHPFTFGGKSAMMRVEGWFTGGIVATIKWDSKRHVIEKHKALVKITINGQSIKKQALKPGDRIFIAKSRFDYYLDE